MKGAEFLLHASKAPSVNFAAQPPAGSLQQQQQQQAMHGHHGGGGPQAKKGSASWLPSYTQESQAAFKKLTKIDMALTGANNSPLDSDDDDEEGEALNEIEAARSKGAKGAKHGRRAKDWGKCKSYAELQLEEEELGLRGSRVSDTGVSATLLRNALQHAATADGSMLQACMDDAYDLGQGGSAGGLTQMPPAESEYRPSWDTNASHATARGGGGGHQASSKSGAVSLLDPLVMSALERAGSGPATTRARGKSGRAREGGPRASVLFPAASSASSSQAPAVPT